MKNMKAKKQGGFVLTAELVLIVTILVFGAIVGLVTMRDSLNAEMHDVAEAIGAVDQSYGFDGLINGENTASTAGSGYADARDTFAGDDRQQSFVDADFVGATAFDGVGSILGGIDGEDATP